MFIVLAWVICGLLAAGFLIPQGLDLDKEHIREADDQSVYDRAAIFASWITGLLFGPFGLLCHTVEFFTHIKEWKKWSEWRLW